MKKNKNKQTRSNRTPIGTADAPVPTEHSLRRVKARRKFKPVKKITWCNGHGLRMDKRFKQMPAGPDRTFQVLWDRWDPLEWERDEDGNHVTLIRN